ncbi:acyl-CoA dehydrogenase family protein [Fodinisporobacter ferrooxydans]|uniref:Acyl-CoA dehydrogenase family protein n=1 Tax=Fodinisporobacter ferrooxydans TaxID=2901836 RepID=A0ABY4CMV8_9BACL|nr:acyl-CoA dehydrogenase family protein [Alicyclobacillaceae bacterium MYW30-H2]
MTEQTRRIPKGGAFLLETVEPSDVFTPEDFTDEHKMIAKTTSDFIHGEVAPHIDRLEHQDWELTVRLLRQAGELGLLAADVPEEYEGLGMDKISSTLISEYITRGGAFALSHGAHVGIGSLPIVIFGNEGQKQKYLPKLASGAWISAYALTEPGSGSDALGARTTAVLSADKTHYVLNGSKQFITNAGFADIFIVYAKIDGEKFTAFIVERTFKGVSTGPEEKKMGIKSSSTRPLILEDVHVPVENVLGEIGKGHVIAFNILNIGRYKLAAGAVGAAKAALEASASYANERKQFGRPIASFPLIQQKLAEMNIQTFLAESMVYRTTGEIETMLNSLAEKGLAAGADVAKGIAEYAIECSINKVFGSEALDFVVDEGVQIHGGYGFIQEYAIERMYRDSRINRIFEGTNEINRLLIPGTLLKKAMKGELDLHGAAKALQAELMGMMPPFEGDRLLEQERHMLSMAKKVVLFTGGLAIQTFGPKLEQEQELLSNLADMMIQIYALESALLRAQKLHGRHPAKAELQVIMVQIFAQSMIERIDTLAKTILAAVAEGDNLRAQLAILKKLTRYTPIHTVALKRKVANAVILAQKYVC